MSEYKDWIWNLIGMLLFSVAVFVVNMEPVSIVEDGDLEIISTPTIDHVENAKGYIQGFDLDSAEVSLVAALNLDSDNPKANFLLGLIFSITEPDRAPGYLGKSSDLDQSLHDKSNVLIQTIQKAEFAEEESYRLVQIGQALGNIDQWHLAYLAFSKAVAEDQEYSEAWAFLGVSQNKIGLNASDALETALELNPLSVSANVFYAQYLAEQDTPEIGLPYLHVAIELEPENNTLIYVLGYYNAAMGNLNEAYTYFEEMVINNPDAYEAWYQLANFSVNFEYQVSTLGMPAARQTLIISPGDPEAMILLGRAYSHLGNPDMAIKLISQALQNSPGNINALYYLGIINAATGNTAEAIKLFQQVISLSTDPDLIEQVQNIIDTLIP